MIRCCVQGTSLEWKGELNVLWRSSYSTVRDWLYLVKADLWPWFLWPTSLHGHHHSLCADGKWDGGRDSGPLLSGRNTPALWIRPWLRMRTSGLLSLPLQIVSTLWGDWDTCDWSPVCSTCCPGIDLLSYQWGLEGGGGASIGRRLLSDGSRGWKESREMLAGLPLLVGWGVLYLKLGPIGRETSGRTEGGAAQRPQAIPVLKQI